MTAGGGDREAGLRPVSGSHAHRLQPGAGADIAAPVPPPDVLRGISSISDVAAARQLEESLRRRAADQRLRDELATHNFSGPQYQQFERELVRYGTSVLRAWMYTGYVFKLASSRGYCLRPSEVELGALHRESDVREELANMTVAVALPKFRQRALIDGGWRPDGGASLSTYFTGACLAVFPNEFRRWRVQVEKWRRQDGRDPALLMPEAELRLRSGGGGHGQYLRAGPSQEHRSPSTENSRADTQAVHPGGDRRTVRRTVSPGR